MLTAYHLPGNLPDEKIIKIVRRDVIILVKKILFFAVLLILPAIVLDILFFRVYPEMFNSQIAYPAVILLVSFYFLFIWLFFFFSFIDYYLDVWVITSERIIDVQQIGFFSRVVSEQRLFRIQDVTSEIHGIIPTVFRYGDVYVQTAGAKQRFKFSETPNPDWIRDEIIRLSEISKKKNKQDVE